MNPTEIMLKAAESGELTTTLAEAQLHEIEAAIDAVLDAADAARDAIREACGESPSALPGFLLTMLLMGTGHIRHARDIIRALWRAKNALARRLAGPSPEPTEAP